MALMQFTIGLVLMNIVVLLYLTGIYIKNFRSLQSKFTIGLLIFALVFLIENIVASYFYFTMMPYYANGIELPAFLLRLLQTIAFLVFLWITRE